MAFDATIYEEGIYDEASVYDAWLRYANERDLFKVYLDDNFDKWATKNPMSIVEIGSGSGATSTRVMDILDNNGVDYTYTGVEPYLAQLDMFRKKVPDTEKLTLVQAGLSDFVAEKSYDLAFVVHSLYYVSNLRESLKKINSFASQALIIHHGPNGINTVHEAFREHVKEGPHIISTYKDLEQALQEEGIPYKLDTFPSQVDIRPIKESGNEDGKKLIEFFLERTDLSDEVIERVREFFRDKPDTMTHEVGIFLTNP